MNQAPSDALVVFGATGDLAGKMIFPAVCALAARGAFDIPLVAVARHAEDAQRKAIDAPLDACARRRRSLDRRVAKRIRYVGGDLQDPATYDTLKKALRGARHPFFYLAIPPSLLSVVAGRLSNAGLARDARVAVDKPFGHDLASARALDATLRAAFPEGAIFRVDHFLAKGPRPRSRFAERNVHRAPPGDPPAALERSADLRARRQVLAAHGDRRWRRTSRTTR